jgi:hypothetical protein
MVPFGKQQEICAIFRRQVQKSCQETAGRLLIEDGVVVTSNEKRATGLWPDRMRRNASRAMIVGAGRVAATARADIGAFESPSKSVGPGLRTDV